MTEDIKYCMNSYLKYRTIVDHNVCFAETIVPYFYEEKIMRLSNDTILSITFGAIRHEHTENGIRFYKCTQKQIDVWSKEREDLGERAAGCTGVRLDFHTDAEWIRFKAPKGKFELLVDDLTAISLSQGKKPNSTPSLARVKRGYCSSSPATM